MRRSKMVSNINYYYHQYGKGYHNGVRFERLSKTTNVLGQDGQ